MKDVKGVIKEMVKILAKEYLPEKIRDSKYYTPSDSGFKQEIKKRKKSKDNIS